MSNASNKDFYARLLNARLLDYGSVIQQSLVHSLLEIHITDVMNIREYDKAKLEEVSAIDYVRSQLLNQGKTIAKHLSAYRIPMPSENREFVERYISSADKKLRRAIKLSMNTPHGDYKPIDDAYEKAIRKRQSLKDAKDKGDFLK